MYNPKIKEELIPQLYIIAKELKQPMTKLVSHIIEEYLSNIKCLQVDSPDIPLSYVLRKELSREDRVID